MSVTLSLMGWDSLWSKKQKTPRKTSAQVYQLNLMVLENGWNMERTWRENCLRVPFFFIQI